MQSKRFASNKNPNKLKINMQLHMISNKTTRDGLKLSRVVFIREIEAFRIRNEKSATYLAFSAC